MPSCGVVVVGGTVQGGVRGVEWGAFGIRQEMNPEGASSEPGELWGDL